MSAAIPEPKEVLSQFYALSAVPHGSGNEKGISDWLLAFAHERGLEAVQDGALNVVIRKPGTAGRADAPGVILQSHMDMVCAKEEGLDFDFLTQGVTPRVEGGRLRAAGTTLGADNGVGMAYALALLDSRDIPHPPLEALFTTGEETGMHGALALDVSVLKGKYLINIDFDREGVFCVGCSGGITARLSLPVDEIDASSLPDAAERGFFALAVDGLRGGHSGVEIDKQRGNANRLLARTLHALADEFDFYLADMTGGLVDNAIPVFAEAKLFLRADDLSAAAGRVAELEAVFRNELKASESADHPVRVALAPADASPTVLSRESARKAVQAANLLPDGAATFDLAMPNHELVESSANFALIRREAGEFVFTVSVRSSLESRRDFLLTQMTMLAGALGGRFETGSGYPGWEYRPDSELRRVFQRAYATVNAGREAKVEGVHAGLECGVFADGFRRLGRDVDMISLGPGIKDGHTPEESLDLTSAAGTWKLIKEALSLLCAGSDAR